MGGQGDSGEEPLGQEFAEGGIDPDQLKSQDVGMDGLGFIDVFKGKLKFWALHCAISALPSYLIVMVWLKQAANPTAHLAMLAAIATFVIGYSVLTSLPGPLTRKDTLLSRALRVGLILRMICSIITTLAVPTGIFLLYTPDFWCGNLATGIVDRIYGFLGHETDLRNMIDGKNTKDEVLIQPGFMEIYLITLFEGLILSLMLFIFSVMAVVILQMRDRKKMFLRETRV
ncbi:MAG: hypothetical protein ACK49X_10005 [Akkermansiaceae bacterium]